MWFDFFAPFGIPFWILMIVGAIGVITDLADDNIFQVIFRLALVVGIVHCFGDERTLGWAYGHKAEIAQVEQMVEVEQKPGDPGVRPPVIPTVSQIPEEPSLFVTKGKAVIAFLLAYSLWLILVGELVVYSVCLRYQRGVWAMGSLIVSVLLLQFVADVPIFQLSYDHPLYAGLGFLAWTLAGVIWLLAPYVGYWWRRVNRYSKRFDTVKDQFLATKGRFRTPENQLPRDLVAEFDADYFPRHDHDDEGLIYKNPLFRDHKAELGSVVAGWPLSMVERFWFDFLINWFDDIIDYATGLGNRITALVFQRHIADEPTAEEKAAYEAAKQAAREAELVEIAKQEAERAAARLRQQEEYERRARGNN